MCLLYSISFMLSTPHVLVGIFLIDRFPNICGLVLALLSHFLLDFCIPHWNPHLYTEFKKQGKISKTSLKIIILDIITAIGATLYFMSLKLPNLSLALLYGLASFMAILPDFVEIPYYFFRSKSVLLKKYVYFEHKYQAGAGVFWGGLIQILIGLAALKSLLTF